MILSNAKIFYKGDFIDADIFIDDKGIIKKISKIEEKEKVKEKTINLRKKIIIPGAIDAHVHFRDLNEKYKESFLTGSRAAIHGGFCCVFEMPNSSPRADTLKIIKKKISLDPKITNMKFYGGIKTLEDAQEIEDYVVGFKCYMYEEEKENKLKILENLNKKITFHAEISKENNSKKNEILALKEIEKLNLKFKPNIAHISTFDGLNIALKNEWTKEITPHHLLLNHNRDKKFNVRPPLRDEYERMKLLENLDKIDMIVSDHAPHTEEEKENGANGFSGIETLIPLMLDIINKNPKILNLKQLIEKICINPKKIFNLDFDNEIEINKKANLTVIDLKEEHKISGDNFESKCKWTPYEGKVVKGNVCYVIMNGRIAMEDGVVI